MNNYKLAAIIVTALTLIVSPGRGQEASPPVVVELFTSQGCSDCPAADDLLSSWGGAQFQKGTVIPLSFDVDYWNYLGWTDIFSTPAYSLRERNYDAALGVGVYTPQMVVNGRAAFVGSDRDQLVTQVDRLQNARPSVRIRISSLNSTRIQLKISVEPLQEQEGNPHVILALFENGLTTKVLRGENGGSTLRNDFVVRRLVDLGPLPADGRAFHKFFGDPWDPSWHKDSSGAVVFIQDGNTLAISDAKALYPL